MLRKFVFVTSLLIGTAHAETELSGFIYNTSFGDNHWQKDRTILAVNVDSMNDYVDVRAQFANYEYAVVRRATLGKTIHIGNGDSATLQFGRMARVDSFFDNVLDTPAASGMAMLPNAGFMMTK